MKDLRLAAGALVECLGAVVGVGMRLMSLVIVSVAWLSTFVVSQIFNLDEAFVFATKCVDGTFKSWSLKIAGVKVENAKQPE